MPTPHSDGDNRDGIYHVVEKLREGKERHARIRWIFVVIVEVRPDPIANEVGVCLAV